MFAFVFYTGHFWPCEKWMGLFPIRYCYLQSSEITFAFSLFIG